MKVVASGVDTLHLSARGEVRADVLERLEEWKLRAQDASETIAFEFPATGQAFMLRPYGLRGYAYWLSSPDFELIVGRSDRFPPILVQLHSPYLHACGQKLSVDLVELLLDHDVFVARTETTVSRIDLYADTQGWDPTLPDLERFVCFAPRRRAFQELDSFTEARRLTGFMFGKGAVVARVYDKTRELAKRGTTWPLEIWRDVDRAKPVWRVEFQFRRHALNEFHVQRVDDVAITLQDLWTYATERWLTLRTTKHGRRVRRRPIDPIWKQVQGITIAPAMSGVIRRRIEGASEERLVRGLMGYLTALAGMRGQRAVEEAIRDGSLSVLSYLTARDRTFEAEASRKAERYLSLTAPLDDLDASRPGSNRAGRGCERELRVGEIAVDVGGVLLCTRCAGLDPDALRFAVRWSGVACGADLRRLLAEQALAGPGEPPLNEVG